MILYKNILREPQAMLEDGAGAFSLTRFLWNGRTSEPGIFSGASSVSRVDLQTPQYLDTLAIAKHNVGSSGGSIEVAGSVDDVSYTVITTLTPTNDNVAIQSFAGVSYRYIRLTFTNPETVNTEIGIADLYLGPHKDLQRSQKFGFIKPEFSDQDQVISNLTTGNNLVGIDIIRKPRKVRFNLFYYTADFFNDWAEMIDTMKRYPIYVQWAPGEQPFYCWLTKTVPQPRYSQQRNDMYDVVLDMSGLV